MVQESARPMRMAMRTASWLRTGSDPGSPRHTGHTLVFGRAPKEVEQPQKSLVFVSSCACTSRPMTGSNSVDMGGGIARPRRGFESPLATPDDLVVVLAVDAGVRRLARLVAGVG